MDQMAKSIFDNAIVSSLQRVDHAKHDLYQCQASVRFPVAGGGDQTSSNKAATIVAEAKLAGARAELHAITAAFEAAKKSK